jgi:hypothetical protein
VWRNNERCTSVSQCSAPATNSHLGSTVPSSILDFAQISYVSSFMLPDLSHMAFTSTLSYIQYDSMAFDVRQVVPNLAGSGLRRKGKCRQAAFTSQRV